jgi:hypothetical protein
MNPLMLQLIRDLRQGEVRVQSGRMRATDLVEHVRSMGAQETEATAAVRDLLTRMTNQRRWARRPAAVWPTCPRCQGGMIPAKVYDEDQPERAIVWRCANCGD